MRKRKRKIGGGQGNQLASNYNNLVGGCENFVSVGNYASVLGGGNNKVVENYAAIAGGCQNCIDNSGIYGFIGGGGNNCIYQPSGVVQQYNMIGGGYHNTVCASYNAILVDKTIMTPTCQAL